MIAAPIEYVSTHLLKQAVATSIYVFPFLFSDKGSSDLDMGFYGLVCVLETLKGPQISD